ncbi:MAG: nuclear transport factor 2 family protein [Candidatus Omnitrophica bacterium]|nr:nuclear transport factor 2 family protein [Candidatus Omnitrophota bacterium]MCB9747852.1 nuclear transport factor 2 family protein [Candidatus Omnitrophota bacterium]
MGGLTSNKPKHWNEAQNNVWQCVEDHWNHLINKRVDDFIQYIHDDMVGYGHESPIPVDKPWLHKWVGFWTKSTDIVICELRPIDIRIHGDIAILQYLIFTIEKNVEGGKRVIRRYTMTWKKQPERWVVIASHNNLMDETLRG